MMEDLRRIDPKQIAEINRQLLQDTKVTDKLGQLELVEKDGHCVALSKELHKGIEVTSEQRATDNLGFEGPFFLPVSYAANGYSITEQRPLTIPNLIAMRNGCSIKTTAITMKRSQYRGRTQTVLALTSRLKAMAI